MPSRKARRPAQPPKSTSSPTTTATASSSALDTKAERLAARTVRRKTQADDRRVKADVFKDQGNGEFKKGNYETAAKYYEAAILVYGPKAVYLNNLAACLLKLERYEEAQIAARGALARDSKLVKARYRLALAQKGQNKLHCAFRNLSLVVAQDPGAREAVDELRNISSLLSSMRHNGLATDSDTDSDGCYEHESEPETVVLSDSSDFEHAGNGIPCRYYNHDGCTRGAECKFKHAPDNRSIRDQLGRNVCVFYLLGFCKFSAEKCVYAHDKTYLAPSQKKWDDPSWIESTRAVAEFLGAHRCAEKLEELMLMLMLKPPITHEGYLPRVKLAQSRLTTEASISEFGGYDESDGWNEEEEEERAMNCGFTNAEVEELLCQGVKPWDDDAWDVLSVLRDM